MPFPAYVVLAIKLQGSLLSANPREPCLRAMSHARPPINRFQRIFPVLSFARTSKYLNSPLDSAAKNHFGKVLYGNMYSEIKSGAACNTLVAEYVLRKNARGDAKLDMEVSPFLRENLRDPLPSLDKRQRRHRRRQAPAAGASKAAPAPLSPDDGSVAITASTIMGDGTEAPDAVDSEGEDSLAGNKHGDGDGSTSGEGRFPQTHNSGGRNGNLMGRGRGIGGRNEREERPPHRPAQMDRAGELRTKNCSGGTARDLVKNRSPLRSAGGEIDKQPITVGARMTRKIWMETDPGTADNVNDGRRRRRGKGTAESSTRGDGIHEQERGRRISTSASLKTLSLRDMGERQDNLRSHGNAEDALDRWVEHLISGLRELRTLPVDPASPWCATVAPFPLHMFHKVAHVVLDPSTETGFSISS